MRAIAGWLMAGLLSVLWRECQAAELRCVRPDSRTGSAAAVAVDDVPLVHTTQLLPVMPDGTLVSTEPPAQVEAALDRLAQVLQRAGSSLPQTIRISVCVTRNEIIPLVQTALGRRFSGDHKPAVSYVVSRLPVAGAVVAVDAVAAVSRDNPNAVLLPAEERNAGWSVMPSGSRIYIAGQAEPGPSLAEMTQRTLASLSATLKFLERSDADIAQLKCFVYPMTDIATVRQVIDEFYQDRPVPPVVFVEWLPKTSIEIELVAWGGSSVNRPGVEYLTPPKMTASPVFSRVARINGTPSVYTSSLTAAEAAASEEQSQTPEAGEREVKAVFAELDSLLKATGSDWRHLVKATYYCSTDAASRKLNELRPQYYDPARPPSASKAIVTGTGRSGIGLTIDMIAVPVKSK